MIIDSFLFFQELDLLEIRLEYLYPLVDKFLIVEAKQTFTGSPKEFVFEKNIKRYSRYIDKINYYKIEDIHLNNKELTKFLEDSTNEVQNFIAKIIKEHRHYNKENLSHLLDSYHRECIHILLRREAKNEDTIIFSDLDEIPDFKILRIIKKINNLDKVMVFVQNEFQYYLNNYSNSDWYGSIVAPYKLLKNQSLNELRIKAKELPIIGKAGYHFTSVGSVESIKNKIESWGHQEFNHKIVKNNLKKNIINGKDIFYRVNRKDNRCIELDKSALFDKRMIRIISKYNLLILNKIDYDLFFNISYLYKLIFFNLIRISKNPKSFFKKISSFIIKRK